MYLQHRALNKNVILLVFWQYVANFTTQTQKTNQNQNR